MKTKGIIGLLAILALLTTSAAVFAQPMPGGGWGTGSAYNRLYNPSTVETMSGEVVKVDRLAPIKGMSYGVHLQLKTDKETIPVHLGPAWYIDRQKINIRQGDKIEVTGSRVTFNGAPAIIASEVRKGDAVLKLRDTNGIPVWSGRGGR